MVLAGMLNNILLKRAGEIKRNPGREPLAEMNKFGGYRVLLPYQRARVLGEIPRW